MISNPTSLILRQRAPDVKGNSTGWLILLVGANREREILAILTRDTGLENARAVAQLLASRYGIPHVSEEQLDPQIISNLQDIYQYPDF